MGKKAAILIVVLLLMGGAWWLTRTPAFVVPINADQNVLLITIDTLRADALSVYGGKAATPNIDRLAARGARFDFAHAHAVVTLVSHSSILSGRYPYETGVRDNSGYRFPQTLPTAATLLKAQGFATGAFIGGFPLDHRFGLNVGFDMYDDNLAPNASGEGGERERRADAVVTSALGWINKQQGKWFSWVHVYDPHVKYSPPPEFLAKYPKEPYYGEVAWTDFALGPLFDRLATESRPTLVIITADHGEGLGDHGEMTHSVFAYESTLHVPLIITELGNTVAPQRGVTIETPARHVDLLPTMLEAVGAPAAPNASGSSLRDVIAKGSGPDRPSYFEAMSSNLARGWAPLRGVLVGADKFIDLPIEELYNLKTDAKELRNIAPSQIERDRVMMSTLASFSIAAPGRPQQETSENVEALRSLGYVGGASAAPREKYSEADDPKRLITIEQDMTRGTVALQAGKFEEAEAAFQGVIKQRPDTEDAYRKLALVYWRGGKPMQAVATLEGALRAGVTQVEVKIRLGEYLARTGQAAKAITLLSTVPGDDPDALVALGNAYLFSGRNADAMRTFQHLAAVDPRNGLAFENIGVMKLQANDVAGAEQALRKALEIDSSLSGAYTALGVVLAKSGKRDDAIDAWKRAVTLDPTDFNAMLNLITNLGQAGRASEAMPYAERFIATAPPELARDVAAVKRMIGREH